MSNDRKVYILRGLRSFSNICRLKFPSIFIAYGTVALGVLELIFLVGYFDRKALFCTSRELIQSIWDPTKFCMFQGLPCCKLVITSLMYVHEKQVSCTSFRELVESIQNPTTFCIFQGLPWRIARNNYITT